MKNCDRKETILEASVRYFIDTGKPVTSAGLFNSFNFGIKPAMIRCELNKLGDLGYFLQNHPSGGRIPTHKAYRFFVEKLLIDKKLEKERSNDFVLSLVKFVYEGNSKSFLNEVAKRLDSFSMWYEPREAQFLESGLYELFEELNFDNRKDLLRVVEDMEELGDRITGNFDFWENVNEWPQIFIGESPVTKSRNLSVIVDKLNDGEDDFLLFMVGPNRMNYERSIKMLRALENILNV